MCDYRRIEGDENSNQLSKLGSECPFIGPEPTCVTSAGAAKKVIRDSTETTLDVFNSPWTCKSFLQEPSVRRTGELLKVNRNQLWQSYLQDTVTWKEHLFKLGLTRTFTCEMCLEKDESATHVLCNCKARSYLYLALLYGTRQLKRHPFKWYTLLHLKCSTVCGGAEQRGGSQ